MPSTQTITAFYSYSANTLIESAKVNNNFDVFRGHIIPVSPNTATAGTTGSYDLGSTDYAWRNVYAQNIVLATAAASISNWNKYSISYTDLQAATATNFSEIFSSPALGTIERIVVRQTAAFTGGTLSDVDIMLGTSADQDRFVMPYDAYNTSTVEDIYSVFDVPAFDTATSIRVYATATGSTLDSLAAGALDVYVLRGALE